MMSICNGTEVPRQKQGSAVTLPAFKPPQIADSSNTNQRLSVNKFYLNIYMGGNKSKTGTNHSQPGYWHDFEINPIKRHVEYCFGSKSAYT